MFKLFLTFLFVGFLYSSSFAQIIPDNLNQTNYQLENIEKSLGKISRSINEFNELLKNFSQTFSSNQGLRLTEKQQRILAAFEYLNRAEQRLANLQNLKIDLVQKQTNINLQLAQIEDDLRPESIDRSIALRGTTDAEELRDIRRQALNRQRGELRTLSGQISRDISEIDYEIQQTQQFLKRIRDRIFPEIEKELSDL
jgi:chromosome segregation ATPase